MGLCSSSNIKYQTNNPAHEITCPEGALRVQPGLNSLSKAVKEAKEKDMKCLFLLSGFHDEKGEWVTIDFALKVVGQNRDDVKIKASLLIKGKKEEDVFFSDCTVTGAKGSGVGNRQVPIVNDESYEKDECGFQVILTEEGAAMHLKNVCVEKCGNCGIYVSTSTRNTMTDCNVNNNKECGVTVEMGRMIIDGSATTIHHNVTSGDSRSYGLDAYSSSASIHLKSLTKESISTNNGGGNNYGGKGTIKTI